MVVRRGLLWTLERLSPKGFWPEETRDRRVRRSTGAVEDVDRASCSASVWLRWGAKQELGGGEPFDDVHSSTADCAVPDWVGLIRRW